MLKLRQRGIEMFTLKHSIMFQCYEISKPAHVLRKYYLYTHCMLTGELEFAFSTCSGLHFLAIG